MSLINQRPGIGSVPSFQVSGWPFVTGSFITASVGYVKVTLPSVAKSITVHNIDGSDLFPYTLTGSCPIFVWFGVDLTGTYPPPQVTNRHTIAIPVSGSKTFDVKCSQFFVGKRSTAHFGAFQVVAELTNIDYVDMYLPGVAGNAANRDSILTGTGIHD